MEVVNSEVIKNYMYYCLGGYVAKNMIQPVEGHSDSVQDAWGLIGNWSKQYLTDCSLFPNRKISIDRYLRGRLFAIGWLVKKTDDEKHNVENFYGKTATYLTSYHSFPNKTVTHYFDLPMTELSIKKRYPDAIKARLSIELPENSNDAKLADVEIAPVDDDFIDFDWEKFSITEEDINALLCLVLV